MASNDQEILFNFIYDMLYKTDYEALDVSKLATDNQNVGQALNFLSEKLKELRAFSYDLATGNIDDAIASRDNPFTGPLKDLQANLRHLTWQTKQIAHGDYNQKVEFLGEFSTSFNSMVEILKNREELIIENARKEKELADEKNRSLEQALDARADYYEEIMQVNNEMRAFRHDVNNHLISIQSLIENGKSEEAAQYIRTITKSIAPIRTISTENYVLDSLLTNKEAKALKKNIKYTLKIDIGKNLRVEASDWAALFGNILDNAIEAASKVPVDPFITIELRYRAHSLAACITNNYVENELNRDGNGNLLTSKGDKANHGIGLVNIRRIVEKYGGTLVISPHDGIFALSFVLFNV